MIILGRRYQEVTVCQPGWASKQKQTFVKPWNPCGQAGPIGWIRADPIYPSSIHPTRQGWNFGRYCTAQPNPTRIEHMGPGFISSLIPSKGLVTQTVGEVDCTAMIRLDWDSSDRFWPAGWVGCDLRLRAHGKRQAPSSPSSCQRSRPVLLLARVLSSSGLRHNLQIYLFGALYAFRPSGTNSQPTPAASEQFFLATIWTRRPIIFSPEQRIIIIFSSPS